MISLSKYCGHTNKHTLVEDGLQKFKHKDTQQTNFNNNFINKVNNVNLI